MKTCKKILCLAIMAVMLVTTVGIIPSGAKVYADTAKEPCDYLEGDNISGHDYWNGATIVASYLEKTGNGYMRVEAYSEKEGVAVEYYDNDFMRTSAMTVPPELEYFGGFYATDSNYYIVSGQMNDEESDEKEVFRVTKYDKSWNRIDSCGLYGANTVVPFSSGSCRMDYTDGWLVVRTAHQMYASEHDGLRHQANVTFLVDTENMEITDSATDISWSGTGYVSHSFNQFVKLEDNKIVALDHGDAYPRAAIVINYPTDVTAGSFTSWDCEVTEVLTFAGEIGDNYTGANLGGLEIMDNNYLVAGTSIIQDTADPAYNKAAETQNIFVSAIGKYDKNVTLKWITDYPEGTEVENPYLVKTDGDKCLLLWRADDLIYYALVDETGRLVSEIYSYKGCLSDCAPLIDGDKLIWYVWDNSKIDFYTISLADLSDIRVENKVYDHDFSNYTVKGKTVTFTCGKCNETVSGTFPVEIDAWWMDQSADDGYYTWYPEQLDVDKNYCVWLTCEEADFKDLVLEVEDPDMADITVDEYGDYIIDWKYEGKAVVRVYPKYAPSEGQTYEIWIGPIPITEFKDDVWLGQKSYTYNGKAKKPSVEVGWLERGEDYTVTYKNNVNAGTATAVIKGIGKYKGTIEKKFTITKASVAGKTAKIPYAGYHYTGKNITPKVTINGLTKGSDYTVEYKNNKKVGKATITIKGTGNYKGTLTKTFNIKPKKTAINKLTAGKKQFTVKWQKRTIQNSGYQVRYSTSSKFSTYKTKKVSGVLKGSLKIQNLKPKTNYWVKVRTYKTMNGVTYYSDWTKASKIKTK